MKGQLYLYKGKASIINKLLAATSLGTKIGVAKIERKERRREKKRGNKKRLKKKIQGKFIQLE